MTTYEKAKESCIQDFAQTYCATPKKRNGNVLCLCPFHDDKTVGSFVVYKNGFHCFSCGEHGDIIALAMQIFQCDFKEACEKIAGEKFESEYKKSKPEQPMKEEQIKVLTVFPEGLTKDISDIPFISEYLKLLPASYQKKALQVALNLGIREYEGSLAFAYSMPEGYTNFKVQEFKGFNRTDKMYYLCKGASKGLFGGILIPKIQDIILVEAEKTAFLLNFRAKELKLKFMAVATGGKSISLQQMKALKGKNIYLLPDADATNEWIEAGKKMLIAGVRSAWVLPYPIEGKNDFADMALGVDQKDQSYYQNIDTLNFWNLNQTFQKNDFTLEPKPEETKTPTPEQKPKAEPAPEPTNNDKANIVKQFTQSLGAKYSLTQKEGLEVLKMRNPEVQNLIDSFELDIEEPEKVIQPKKKGVKNAD